MNEIFLVVPPGFEPGSPGPKPDMMDHYTTGLVDSSNRSYALIMTGHEAGKYKSSSTMERICVNDVLWF